MKRMTITENVKDFSYLISSLEGSIDGAISWLEHIKEECEKVGYIKVWIEVDYFSTGFPSFHDDDRELVVKGERWETDKEFEKRKKRVERDKKKRVKEKEKKEEQERKLYKKLQKIYG